MSGSQQCTNSKKKKKKHKKNDPDSGLKIERDVVCTGTMGNTVEACERKPLHTSMELLHVAAKCGGSVPVVSRKAAGSNWEAQVKANTELQTVRPGKDGGVNEENKPAAALSKAARRRQKRKAAQLSKYVAMDCEMVGVGFGGQEDMLARVSLVDKRGEVLLDKFVKAREPVTDYRTSVSGIRPHDIENGEEFEVVQGEVIQLIRGKILVGHAIRNDLAVLHIKHPFANIRDTARYKPLCRLVANGRTPSLKRLSQAILGLEIQTGEHNSVEDARAAMNIYNRLSSDWEAYLKKHQHKL